MSWNLCGPGRLKVKFKAALAAVWTPVTLRSKGFPHCCREADPTIILEFAGEKASLPGCQLFDFDSFSLASGCKHFSHFLSGTKLGIVQLWDQFERKPSGKGFDCERGAKGRSFSLQLMNLSVSLEFRSVANCKNRPFRNKSTFILICHIFFLKKCKNSANDVEKSFYQEKNSSH